MTRAQVVEVIRRGVRDAGSYRAYGARVGLESSWLSQLVRGRGSFGAHSLRQLGLVDVRIVEQVEGAPVESVQRMTREQVEAWVRSDAAQYGGRLSVYARRRHAWTPYTLRAVGLEGVAVVAEVQTAPVRHARPYRPMWRLGDWPRGMIG